MRIGDLTGVPLHWKQPRIRTSTYELRRGEDLVGKLAFRSGWGSFATADIDRDQWTFKRVGFFQTRATVRRPNDETDLAVFRNNTWALGGTIELAGGGEYRISSNLWQSKFELVGEGDKPLVRFTTRRGLRMTGVMEILPDGKTDVTERQWLVMLAWYVAVMMYRDSAVVVV